MLEHGPLPEPCLALLVSGGHSSLLLVPDVTVDVRPLGATIDDAAGEAFDKVARVLGLPFPGGPYIDRAARDGHGRDRLPARADLRRDMERHRFDFSFSGLKTAVSRWVELRERSGESVPVADVAASFQEAVVDVLTRKAVAACRRARASTTCSSVAGSRRTRGCGRSPRTLRGRDPAAGPAAGAVHRQRRDGRGPGCADGGPWRQPSALDLPADSSMPVTAVLA